MFNLDVLIMIINHYSIPFYLSLSSFKVIIFWVKVKKHVLFPPTKKTLPIILMRRTKKKYSFINIPKK